MSSVLKPLQGTLTGSGLDILEATLFIQDSIYSCAGYGYRWVHLFGNQSELNVRRDTSDFMMKLFYHGVNEMRSNKRLRRWQKIARGAGIVWKLHSYNKKKRYEFIIGCLDGFSRHITHTTSSKRKLIAGYYMYAIFYTYS